MAAGGGVPVNFPLRTRSEIIELVQFLNRGRSSVVAAAGLLSQQTLRHHHGTSFQGNAKAATCELLRCLFADDIRKRYTFRGTPRAQYNAWVDQLGVEFAERKRRDSLLDLDPRMVIDKLIHATTALLLERASLDPSTEREVREVSRSFMKHSMDVPNLQLRGRVYRRVYRRV